MGNVFADIELGNPRKPNPASVRVRALADTGALMLCIPEHVAVQLDLDRESTRSSAPCPWRTWTWWSIRGAAR